MALGRNNRAFWAVVRRYAQDHGIPWVTFCKGDRKLDVIRPYLDAPERADQSKVVAIGKAREFQWVFDATKKDGPDGARWFKFYRTRVLLVGVTYKRYVTASGSPRPSRSPANSVPAARS